MGLHQVCQSYPRREGAAVSRAVSAAKPGTPLPRESPEAFVAKYPKYIYRSGKMMHSAKGYASVQWRQAALEMCADRAALVAALRQQTAYMAAVDGLLRTLPVPSEHAFEGARKYSEVLTSLKMSLVEGCATYYALLRRIEGELP